MTTTSEPEKTAGSVAPKKNKKKRGMKPRSQRNRRRPRLEDEAQTFEKKICRLELDGKLIGDTSTLICMVQPYPYTFSTFAKARWLGRTVLDIYHKEFGSYPKSYYESAISQGRILVSDQMVDTSYVMKGQDILTHTVHRHEPAVAVSTADGSVKVVHESSDLIVVDKPGTLPVHPCGGYHINSLIRILEPKYGKLYTINRLDRLTSGLVLLAKSSAVAQKWGRCLMERDGCEKVYVARVRGKFPLACRKVLPLSKVPSSLSVTCRNGEWVPLKKSDSTSNADGGASESEAKVESGRQKNAFGYWITDMTNNNLPVCASLSDVFASKRDVGKRLAELSSAKVETERQNGIAGTKLSSNNEPKPGSSFWLHLACPVRVTSPKDGVCEAGSFHDLEKEIYQKTVKPAETAFSVVRYDPQSDSTILLVKPTTGRTHQIRLHLELLGHPIGNDPNYGGSLFYGDKEGEHACQSAREQLDDMDNAKANNAQQSTVIGPTKAIAQPPEGATTTDMPATEDEVSASLQPREEGESLQEYIQKTCVWCARSRGFGNNRTMLEYLVRSRGIWLHALKYSMVDSEGLTRLKFQTKPPIWSIEQVTNDNKE